MLTEYIRVAMGQATYEILPDSGTFYGQIVACPGVWADAESLEACRDELQSVLEDWIVLGLRRGHDLPVLGGINLTPALDLIEDDEAPQVAA